MTVAADVLYAFVLPLVELTYKKASQSISYTLVLKMQLVLCFVASCFCLVGMLASGDFKELAREAREFKLGGSNYYYVARVFLGVYWDDLLCIVSRLWGSHQCSASVDRGFGCHFLQGEVSGGERCLSVSIPVGIRLLLLWTTV
ncbi:hypothetical protein Rs2_31324 [Raphanus sativus]|nr:hypothetical protein Rs2_31324 [Raphanus sativus]